MRTLLVLQRNPVKLWGLNGHPFKDHALGNRQEPVKQLNCECGKIAFYRVRKQGYCEGHRTEAYKAQAEYWANKYGRIYV